MKENFLLENLIAHRGYFDLKENIPENSIKAFEKAIKYKYIIELDVYLTKDNEIVVFHDNNLKRACGINKDIEHCTYKELKRLYLFNTSSKIPLLKQVLELVNNKVPIIIEIKGNNKYGGIEHFLIKLLDNYKGRYAIQSFNPFHILWFKKNRPSVPRGLIKIFYRQNKKKKKNLLDQILSLDFFLKNTFIAKDVRFFSEKTKRRNKKIVIGWTIRTKEEYDKYKEEYSNLICENMCLYKEEGHGIKKDYRRK